MKKFILFVSVLFVFVAACSSVGSKEVATDSTSVPAADTVKVDSTLVVK